MIRFNNDYNHIAHPKILQAFSETTGMDYPGYGEDKWCCQAVAQIRRLVGNQNAAVYFFPGATQANVIGISALLGPCDSVIAPDTGHINCHECASIEHTGHKILALPSKEGKISAVQVEKEAALYYDNEEAEYLTRPKMVYISFPTEYGTIYSKQELTDIFHVCKKYDMFLFIDGARLGYGLMSEESDLTLEDLGNLCDLFYIGGTKCGAVLGEALVIANCHLVPRFKANMKQNGALLAKGWILGLQFCILLEKGLYFEIAKRADALACQIREAFRKKGIPFYVESSTNQQFVILTNKQAAKLGREFIFAVDHKMDENHICARFCTSWSTKEDDVVKLMNGIEKL